MYVLSEFTPYEGSEIREFETEDHVKAYIKKAKVCWGCDTYYLTLYEVVQEIDVNEFIKES